MRPINFQGNVHVLNFPPETTPGELAALFDDYGLVMGAQIKMIETAGGRQRLGIVALAPDTAADRAVEALQGHALGDRKLRLVRTEPQIRKARPPAPRKAPPPSADRYGGASVEHFAPRPRAPRQVIVEYRGRRPLSRI
jgi:RNA recognition motif-containing protein